MITSYDFLGPADWKLLDQLGAATTNRPGAHAIKLRPLPGWPFAWLLHPGLTDGLTVADTTSLARLEEAGLIDIDQKSGSQRAGQEILLTPRGEAAHKRRMYSGGHDGWSSHAGDISDQHGGGGWD